VAGADAEQFEPPVSIGFGYVARVAQLHLRPLDRRAGSGIGHDAPDA